VLNPGKTHRKRKDPAVQSKGQQRAAQILRTARKIFIDDGYSSMTVRNICDELDISMGTLHYYFDRKSAILHALVNETIAQYDNRFRELFASMSDDAHGKFFALVDFLVKDIKNRDTRRFFIQLYSIAIHDSEVDRYRADFHRFGIQQLVGVLRELPENQHVEDLELKKRAVMINAMLDGLMVLMGTNPRNIPNMSRYLDGFRDKAFLIATTRSEASD
jgi:AcrR family transcriptional regulator